MIRLGDKGLFIKKIYKIERCPTWETPLQRCTVHRFLRFCRDETFSFVKYCSTGLLGIQNFKRSEVL